MKWAINQITEATEIPHFWNLVILTRSFYFGKKKGNFFIRLSWGTLWNFNAFCAWQSSCSVRSLAHKVFENLGNHSWIKSVLRKEIILMGCAFLFYLNCMLLLWLGYFAFCPFRRKGAPKGLVEKSESISVGNKFPHISWFYGHRWVQFLFTDFWHERKKLPAGSMLFQALLNCWSQCPRLPVQC